MTIERVGVVGAGTMGHGIAQAAAQAGYATLLCDIADDLVAAALDRIAANLDKGISLGKVAEAAAEAALQRLDTTTDLDEVASRCGLIVEAIPEDLELKRSTFRRLEAACSDSTILATNTSSLSIAAIGGALRDAGRLVGMHFFNPVHVMKLVEVVRHDGTRPEVLAEAVAVAESMEKTAIVVRDVPGFATSRLGVLLGLEAMRMVEQGVASAADIDTAMELGYRHPMGPLKLTDLVGLDVRLAIARYLHTELGDEAFRPPRVLERMVEEGRLGKKSGGGFYDW